MPRPIISLLLAASAAGPLLAQGTGSIPLDDGWRLEDARIDTHLGRRALVIRTGQALRPDVRLEDGTIEFDVAVTRHRSFVYLTFRIVNADEYEEIYFRPHKSSLPDAIQYGPVFRGETNWQLYHGRGSTAPVGFTPDQWTHVKLVIRGRRAALFVGDVATPTTILELARDPVAGSISFQSFVPDGGAPAGVAAAAFSNLVVRPGDVGFQFPEPAQRAAVPGLVTSWQLSPPFAVKTAGAIAAVPDSLKNRDRWPAYPVEPNGILVIGRYADAPARLSGIYGRLVIRSGAAGLQRMDLGYSDWATVFVNGRPHFAGDAHYSFDEPRQEGLIGLGQSSLWLPLRSGDNEILVALVDTFGGRGLIARLDPAGPGRVVSAGGR